MPPGSTRSERSHQIILWRVAALGRWAIGELACACGFKTDSRFRNLDLGVTEDELLDSYNGHKIKKPN